MVTAIGALAVPPAQADESDTLGGAVCAVPPEVVVVPGGGGTPGGGSVPSLPIPPVPVRPGSDPAGLSGDAFRAAAAPAVAAPAPAAGIVAGTSRGTSVAASSILAATLVGDRSGPLLDGGVTYVISELPEAELTSRQWGKTSFKQFSYTPVLRCIDRKTGTWAAELRDPQQEVKQAARLLDGVDEVDSRLVRAIAQSTKPRAEKCAGLAKVSDDLIWESSEAGTGAPLVGPLPRPRTPTKYYMKAAVQAHEKVHLTRFQRAMAPAYRTFSTDIEKFTVTTSSPRTARAAFLAHLAKAREKLTTAFEEYGKQDAHRSPGDFKAKEQAVVAPMLELIGRHQRFLGC